MKLQIVCNKCIIFTLPSHHPAAEEAINKVVHKIQLENSMPTWEKIRVDAYSCEKECLYFVYPEEIQKICIASFALPYLGDYFTE